MRLIAFCLLAALPLQARTRAVQLPVHTRILWVAPHPDDESLIAPLLGKSCVEGESRCTLLVLTRGENGDCKLPGGCGDLGALRAGEMLAAGAALHAFVIQWALPDVLNPAATWPADVAARIATVIASVKPDLIYTFDPNHGSSCHPAHIYTAEMVLRVSESRPVRLVETQIVRNPDVSFAPATNEAAPFDANRSWEWLRVDLEAHRSQFTPEEVEGIANLPAEQRRVWLMDARYRYLAQYRFRCY